jgi:membrane protein implicated in regulation of membrane protease activity
LSFWIIGALRIQLRQAALLSLVVFMLGLAIGRVISLLVDGMPNWLLVVYMVVEFISAFIGWRLLKQPD